MGLIPEQDEQYLKDKGFSYELNQVGPAIHLILHAWPFPDAYKLRSADVLVKIPPGYPMTQLDMFYTNPTVMLAGGAFPVTSDQMENHGSLTWQRWSRHHPWRPGVDNLRSFITAMASEIKKGI